MRRFFRLLTWAIAPFFVYFGLAAAGALVPQSSAPRDEGAKTRDIILVAGLIHYDILLPVDDATRDLFGFVEAAGVPLSNPLVRWLSVGWGSEAFYTTSGTYTDLSARTIWTAATGDAGVIRFEVTGPLPIHPRLRRIAVSEAQLNALRTSIRRNLAARPAAMPLSGFSQTDAFYEAKGYFNLLRTCNVWVADKLSDAGLTMGAWTPTPYAVTWSLWWNGHL